MATKEIIREITTAIEGMVNDYYPAPVPENMKEWACEELVLPAHWGMLEESNERISYDQTCTLLGKISVPVAFLTAEERAHLLKTYHDGVHISVWEYASTHYENGTIVGSPEVLLMRDHDAARITVASALHVGYVLDIDPEIDWQPFFIRRRESGGNEQLKIVGLRLPDADEIAPRT